jgi:hypothetical protein
MGEGTLVAKAKDGSWLLQALGALLILGPIGVCARAEQAGMLQMEAGLAVATGGFVLLYLGSSGKAPASRPLPKGLSLPVPRLVGDEGAIDTVLAITARQCWGEIYLTDTSLYFVCYADRIALGSAAPTRERRDLVRAQLRGMPIERAIAHSKFSRSFAVSEVAGFQKAFWTGQSFRAGGNRYQIVFGWDRSTRDQVRAWCAAHAVRCDGF